MPQLILPTTYVDEGCLVRPVFYLIGPVRGGGGWQEDCLKLLEEGIGKRDFTCVIPRLYPTDHPMARYRVCTGDTGHFERQCHWERHYQSVASRRGCVISWLPNESWEFSQFEGQSFPGDFLGEIGEWRGRLMTDPSLKFVVGTGAEYSGRDGLAENFRCALGEGFPVRLALETTVGAAIAKALAKPKLYVASPYGFSESTRTYLRGTVVPSLERLGFEVIDPWTLTPQAEVECVEAISDPLARMQAWKDLCKKIGERNRKALLPADLVVAFLDGQEPDFGVGVEMGGAAFTGKPVFGCRSDFRQSGEPGCVVNLQGEDAIRLNGGTLSFGLAELTKRLSAYLAA